MQFETYKHRDHRWSRKRHGYIICRGASKDREWVESCSCWISGIPERENRLGGREGWTSSMNLKPETPLIKKLEIKRLEDECENLRLWRWRLTIAIELILITVLGACVINFYAIRWRGWGHCKKLKKSTRISRQASGTQIKNQFNYNRKRRKNKCVTKRNMN